jgi:glycosyltransferase involved in cell wall biosynthesis
MLTAIIATHESERLLVPTLAALVPAAATGFLTSVVVADGASHDGTAEIAELAGCRFMSSVQPLGSRLKSAAASTRSPWLMFLRAGVIPQVGWIDAAEHFIQKTEMRQGAAYAAVFRSPSPSDYIRPSLAEIAGLLRAVMGGYPGAEQGLLIARRFYDAIGGHSDGADAERALFRRLGRRRLAVLAMTVTVVRQDT